MWREYKPKFEVLERRKTVASNAMERSRIAAESLDNGLSAEEALRAVFAVTDDGAVQRRVWSERGRIRAQTKVELNSR